MNEMIFYVLNFVSFYVCIFLWAVQSFTLFVVRAIHGSRSNFGFIRHKTYIFVIAFFLFPLE